MNEWMDRWMDGCVHLLSAPMTLIQIMSLLLEVESFLFNYRILDISFRRLCAVTTGPI